MTPASPTSLLGLAVRWVLAAPTPPGGARAWLEEVTAGGLDRRAVYEIVRRLAVRRGRVGCDELDTGLLEVAKAAHAGDVDETAGWLMLLAHYAVDAGVADTAPVLLASSCEPPSGAGAHVAALLDAARRLDLDGAGR